MGIIYIIYNYVTEWDGFPPPPICDTKYDKDDVEDFIESNFLIYQKDYFDITTLTKEINDIDFQIAIFNYLYGEKGYKYFEQYIKGKCIAKKT